MKKNTFVVVLTIVISAAVLAATLALRNSSDTGSPAAQPPAAVPNPAAPAAPAKAAAYTFVVAGEGNAARYLIREQLAGFDLPNDAVGVTKDVSGSINLDQSGQVIPSASRITVSVGNLQSDKDRRDGFVRSRVLETDRFPRVELVVTGIRGVELPLPASGTRTFSVDGNLTVRGVTRPTIWSVKAAFSGNSVTGKAATKFAFADFDLNQPRVPVVLSVADTIRLEYDFNLQRN